MNIDIIETIESDDNSVVIIESDVISIDDPDFWE